MKIWYGTPTLEQLHLAQDVGVVRHLAIAFVDIGDDYLRARLTVADIHVQPYGILHGGVSVVLAETLGSTGAALTVDSSRFGVVGQEINANHLRPAMPSAVITGTARAFHIGTRSQVWSIEIRDERDRLICISRITMAVIDRPT